ncbi:hypothetical protein CONCODRAFT_170031 [Conidiobolus coronatus NRRL 28638]|uniref:Uncharacterized protein n=1 Tax=Conidiobolus coronatus (strain ATCC 28846 / CBS 209.66 / NRRL 28638) TaxID=796925 RepID=A0A137P8A6_CONC2|nr:hypothetical protein CONCODRAFT_170031 [Conidiobolus coronatus NRRL 28638]|eukprot:KXN71235.1 hypothetical protein CONCODRAFT_170031 [Conidiobolus coronatus NRRL 28638]
MKLTNYIFAISSVFAFRDYFANTAELYKKFRNGKQVDVTFEPKRAQQVLNSDGIQVISIAVHGGKIESETDVFSKMLYDRVIGTRRKSALYSFLSNIDSTESMKYYTGRCIPTYCCEKIKAKNDRIDSNRFFGNGSTCKEYNLKPQGVCKYEEVCYLNAAHITSENFTTTKLNEILPNRYPVSFHGYQDRNDASGKLVHIVLGGLSNQKYKLAETFHKMSGGVFQVAVCKTAGNCRVYKPGNNFEQGTKVDGSGLTGTSKNNFVNKGKGGCGLQIELATTFRNLRGGNRKDWNFLVESIFCTLPKKDEEICDPVRPRMSDSEDEPEI